MAFFTIKKHSLRTRDDQRTKASKLTLRQSLYPLCLVTILFFLWVCTSLGPLRVAVDRFAPGVFLWLARHLEQALPEYPPSLQSPLKRPSSRVFRWVVVRANVALPSTTRLNLSVGAYPLASLGHANWILRHFGYKAVFIWGLGLYGIGALIAWPCLLHKSFGGFCAAIFVIGNGLGSLETAANPYLAGESSPPVPCRWSEVRCTQSVVRLGIRRSVSTWRKLSMLLAPSLLLSSGPMPSLRMSEIMEPPCRTCNGFTWPSHASSFSWQ